MMGQLERSSHFEGLQLHSEQELQHTVSARMLPYNDSNYSSNYQEQYNNSEHPSIDIFEKRMAFLEGGVAAVATSCGQAAQMLAILTIASAGDNIVSTSYLYGGTFNQFSVTFRKFGIHVKFVSSINVDEFEAAIDKNTKAIYVESIGNPKFVVHPLKDLAKLAHGHRIPLVVDNTFGMGGYLIRPIHFGADIVVQSATKWVGGHGTTLGGVVVDSGNFDWKGSGKFPDFNHCIRSLRGHSFVQEYGSSAFAVKMRTEILQDFGPIMNPIAAFLLLIGLETLSLRAEKHCENALALAIWLRRHPKVAWVSYLGLKSHGSHLLAKEYLRQNAFGGVLSFGVKGGAKSANAMVDGLKLASHLANIGDAKTLVIRPSATTHTQSSEEAQHASGVTPDLIRVSVGIEAIRDIIADFAGALRCVPEDVPSPKSTNNISRTPFP